MFQMPWYSQLCITEGQHTFLLLPGEDGATIVQTATGQLWGIFHVIPVDASISTAEIGTHHALQLRGHVGGRTIELYGCLDAREWRLTNREVTLRYHLHDRGSCPHERPRDGRDRREGQSFCDSSPSMSTYPEGELVRVSSHDPLVSPHTLIHRSDQDAPDSTQAPDGTSLSYEEWDAKITALLAEYKVQEPRP